MNVEKVSEESPKIQRNGGSLMEQVPEKAR